ncbi:MAG: endonuclease MutS2, partial [Kaistella sp.]
MHITKDQLEELEFPELLAEIIPFAFSPKTAAKIKHLTPFPIDEAELSLRKVAEFLSSFESDNAIPFSEYEDIDEELKLMVIENFRLDNVAFIKIKSLTEQIGRLQKFFPVYGELFLNLNNDIRDLEYRKEIIDKIDKVFNRFGEVKSEASPILKTLRAAIS